MDLELALSRIQHYAVKPPQCLKRCVLSYLSNHVWLKGLDLSLHNKGQHNKGNIRAAAEPTCMSTNVHNARRKRNARL